MDFVYKFPVVRGIQAHREYYIGMVPLKMIDRLFPREEEYIAPEYRAQRRLNTARIPVISKYILNNRNDYVFSALAASIDGQFRFIPTELNPDVGTLEVSMDATFLINDGQHRKAAILDALNEDPSLGDETISVVFYEDNGLARSQQLFTDLNKHAVKTSNSISELYDSRDDLAVVTRYVISNIPFLNEYTDKEKDILGKYSSNLFTLNTFYTANKRVLQNNLSDSNQHKEFLLDYWRGVTDNIVQWNELNNREISKIDLRENYIITQAVVIQALGRVGNYFYQNSISKEEMLNHLLLLKKVNWRRDSKEWMMRAIRSNGRMMTNDNAVVLTGNVIKKRIQIPLNDDEEKKEKDLTEIVPV